MNAGRELDALVAEKVMQIEPCYCCEGKVHQLPEFSTDIAAAWQIVEKRKDFLISDMGSCVGECGGRWVVNCGIPGDLDYGWGQASTAPHAICLAVLDGAGVQLDEYHTKVKV